MALTGIPSETTYKVFRGDSSSFPTDKLKANLIHKAKVKKQYAKTLQKESDNGSLTSYYQRLLEEADTSTGSVTPRQKTTNNNATVWDAGSKDDDNSYGDDKTEVEDEQAQRSGSEEAYDLDASSSEDDIVSNDIGLETLDEASHHVRPRPQASQTLFRQETAGPQVHPSRRHKPSPFQRAESHADRVRREREERESEVQEQEKAKKNKLEARQNRKAAMSAKTRKGQPLMKSRMEGLLDKVKKVMQ
ncbi:hypothetical protein SAICODRAFT_17208 [Saitoella complicata NRRL Y-17804]|uniref:uncharacterized protein n=1 Tax=Saitoella complicata (strain BCRC 22490 / CBS 7301 / JCM 7358 / NBRC 10748 / NRRL Y-17804) TaxID=698492 RepID=UPI000866D37B|nr:uncharacterized protein SAICODRAFT_17208 [Saitoella complicata NRRL Y-17804]ODQ55462.1 hypothetical protein SAICODRAFT_17208 [Saitoella complicata NRRL Y-17804]